MNADTLDYAARARAIRAAQAKLATRNAAARAQVAERMAALAVDPEAAARLARIYAETLARAEAARQQQEQET